MTRRGPQWFWLITAVGVVAASMILTPGLDSLTLFGFQLPGVCTFRRIFGVGCPGCGLTRSFVFMGHGQLRQAFDLHMLGPLLYAVVAGQIPLRIWRLMRGRGPVPASP